MSYVSEKMDGFSPERRNREIAERITTLLENKDEIPRTGDLPTLSWEAYLFVGHDDRGVPPCIWLVNNAGAGDVLEFGEQKDAEETFEDLKKVYEEDRCQRS